jgi:periplasmic copper chaperone A
VSYPAARRRALRLATVLSVAATAAVLGAAPAFAHVTAQPGIAAQGGYSVVSLRVPNESDAAGTVKLEVTLPADHPLSSVRTTPVPGWTATMAKAAINPPVQVGEATISEAVRTVTWTANPGTRIGPGEFLEFPLSVGPLPTGVEEIALPAVQTYDDGEVVAWDQPMNPDGSEPERPAPTLTLTPAVADGHGGGHDAAAAPADTASQQIQDADTTDNTARWLAGAGLLVGALGLGVGGGAVLRTRRTTRPEPTGTGPTSTGPEREHSGAGR